MSRRTKARQMIEGRAAASLEALQAAQPSFLGSIFESMPDYLGRQQLARQAQADQALANEMRAREELGAQRAEMMLPNTAAQFRAMGLPGADPTTGMQRAATAERMLQDPTATSQQVAQTVAQSTPYGQQALAQQKATAAQDRQWQAEDRRIAEQARIKAEQDTKRSNLVALRQSGRLVRNIEDLQTIQAEENSVWAPNYLKGYYESARTQLLLDLKNVFELGVLSADDRDILEQIISDATDITGTQSSRAGAMQALQERAYFMLENEAITRNSPFEPRVYVGEKRSVQDILAPLKGDLQRVTPEEIEQTRQMPESPQGSMMPFGQFMRGIGF